MKNKRSLINVLFVIATLSFSAAALANGELVNEPAPVKAEESLIHQGPPVQPGTHVPASEIGSRAEYCYYEWACNYFGCGYRWMCW